MGFLNEQPVNYSNKSRNECVNAAKKIGFSEVLGPGDKNHETHIHLALPR